MRTGRTGARTWLSGRASPCQGEGRGFESRRPLGGRHSRPAFRSLRTEVSGWSGREARQRPAKPYTWVRIPSPPRSSTRAIGAAVARFPDTEEVTGSIPVSPTSKAPGHRPGAFAVHREARTGSLQIPLERGPRSAAQRPHLAPGVRALARLALPDAVTAAPHRTRCATRQPERPDQAVEPPHLSPAGPDRRRHSRCDSDT